MLFSVTIHTSNFIRTNQLNYRVLHQTTRTRIPNYLSDNLKGAYNRVLKPGCSVVMFAAVKFDVVL